MTLFLFSIWKRRRRRKEEEEEKEEETGEFNPLQSNEVSFD
jgi:hypothetical protein